MNLPSHHPMGGFDNLAYLTRLFVCLFGLFRLPHLTFSPRPVALIIGKLCIADSHRGWQPTTFEVNPSILCLAPAPAGSQISDR
jgi:hypothetical protein